MADTTIHPLAGAAAGVPASVTTSGPSPAVLISFTPRVQELCESRGLWANGQPQGELAALLATTTLQADPFRGSLYCTCTGDEVDALVRFAVRLQLDMWAAGCTRSDNVAVGQWLRRLRDATHKPAPRPQRAPHWARVTAPQPAANVAPLFADAPVEAKARQAYVRHVMGCVRDLVDFTQTSAYAENEARAEARP